MTLKVGTRARPYDIKPAKIIDSASRSTPTAAHFLTASRRLRRSRLDRLSSSEAPAPAAANAAASLSVTASAAPYCHISPLVPCDPPT